MTYQQGEDELAALRSQVEALTRERDALRAQFKGVGHVPYLDRMKELAHRAEKAEAERDDWRDRFGVRAPEGILSPAESHAFTMRGIEACYAAREKAEAERDALKAALADTKQRAERNAREALAKLRQRNAALADVTRLKAAPEQVEFYSLKDDSDANWCPWCGGLKPAYWDQVKPHADRLKAEGRSDGHIGTRGHEPDCPRQAALSPRGEGPTAADGAEKGAKQ
jgi:hypothetical protein